jgi:hypothetical protein
MRFDALWLPTSGADCRLKNTGCHGAPFISKGTATRCGVTQLSKSYQSHKFINQ